MQRGRRADFPEASERVAESRRGTARPHAAVSTVAAMDSAWSTAALTTLVQPLGKGNGGEELRAGMWASWEIAWACTLEGIVTQ